MYLVINFCCMSSPSVAMDEDGIVPKDLERAIRENSGGIPQIITDDKPYWAMLYTIPTFHNPTGRLLSPGEKFPTAQ